MKGKNAIISILSIYPELADEWIKDEENNKIIGKGYQYFNNVSMQQLKNIATNNLFKDYNLYEISSSLNCNCTS